MNNAVKRVATALILMLTVIGGLILNNQIVYSIFTTLLAIIGVYECNRVFKVKGHHPIPFGPDCGYSHKGEPPRSSVCVQPGALRNS